MNCNNLGDEYLLLKELGVGGYAKVYKAKNLKYGYIRAIRVLETHVDDEESKIYHNFIRECGVLLRLGNGSHPNIVRLYQPRLLDGRAFVEMDWIDGVDLRQLIERHNGAVPVKETLKMVKEIGSALAFCHHDIYKVCYDRETDALEDADDGSALITPEIERRLIEKYRVIHNDIHTGNIMRRNDGTYILLDFGLAVDGKDDVVNSSRRQQGAVEFLSAQRLDGESPTTQDDIYGFGCVLYAMLTGKPPFPAQKKGKEIPVSELARLCDAHRKLPPKPIERTDVPQWLKDMTMRCLAKNPSDRYADGYELNQEILSHLNIDDAVILHGNSGHNADGFISRDLQFLQSELEKEREHYRHFDEILKVQADIVNKIKDELYAIRKKSPWRIILGIMSGLLVGGLAVYFYYSSQISMLDYELKDANERYNNRSEEYLTQQATLDSLENKIVELNKIIATQESKIKRQQNNNLAPKKRAPLQEVNKLW